MPSLRALTLSTLPKCTQLPPHPGPVAAAGLLHADIGWLTIIGIAISIPVGIVGYFAAKIINTRQYAMSVEVLEQMQLAPASEEGATKLSDKINPPAQVILLVLGCRYQ